MLRQRSWQKPSSFRSERIAFLDPWFTCLWCNEYNRDFVRKEKKWVFPKGYFDVYNRISPTFAATNKKWGDDVDTLYIAHNVKGDHWVALEVNLVKKKIKVYDSIYTHVDDNFIFNTCKPYKRMIPLLMRQAASQEKRKQMVVAAFSIYRVKTIPQNYQVGDCGVYTVKYIECLALGHSMDGLSDATIGALRWKLAAEIYDKVPEAETVQLSDTNPRGNNLQNRVPLQTDSAK